MEFPEPTDVEINTFRTQSSVEAIALYRWRTGIPGDGTITYWRRLREFFERRASFAVDANALLRDFHGSVSHPFYLSECSQCDAQFEAGHA
jgi:hypothetical protein